MRPPSYYNALATHTGYSGSNSTNYSRTSTSQQLRSSIGGSSSTAYVTSTHLPFVSPSVLVAHCITGAGTSTRPYVQGSPAATSTLSRYGQSSTRRAPSSYLSSSSYSPRAPASYLSSTGRTSAGLSSSNSSRFGLASSSYYKPIRLRERPQLSLISSQLRNTTLTDTRPASYTASRVGQVERESAASRPAKPAEDESWSSDVARNISRNKYLIKFREFDHRKAPQADSETQQEVAEEPPSESEKTVLPDEEKMRLLARAENEPPPVHDQVQNEIQTTELTWDPAASEPSKVPIKERRNIKPKIKNLRAEAEKTGAGYASTDGVARVKRVIKRKAPLVSSQEKQESSESQESLAKTRQPEPQVQADAQPIVRVDSGDLEKRIRFRQYSLDDFNFLTVLGHGGWGFVILAELKKHDAYFAVKCIKKITIIEDDDFDSIMIERKVLTLGNLHPFICKLFCTFESEGYLFFAMEYCAGGDLMFHVQHEGKFDEPRCRFYAAEIICAIRFLHNRHIIYRDLKLDNILLDAQGHVRLVDFGMCQCRTYREELLPSNFCGTPEYISPEIIKGIPYNHSVDWWSFGVLLYEMAVGKMPFRGSDENELLWNVCYEQIHYPMFLSKELTKLLEQLLEREPSKRMGMASCKAGDIHDQAWFAGLDWAAVEQLSVPVPFVPQVNSKRDVQNFDADFTSSTPELSPVDPETLERIGQDHFQGFPYTNPNIFIFE